MSNYHIPVLLDEAISFLDVKKGAWYIDCNLGGGGHTREILARGGRVLGIDLDQEAIQETASSLGLGRIKANSFVSDRLILHKGNFADLSQITSSYKLFAVAGVLFDLGVSSHQVDKKERGFSFNQDSILDMRMDQTAKTPLAADLVNGLYERELAELFLRLGEERFAKQIARKIVLERQKAPITTADQLAKIILTVRKRGKSDRTHPATRVFQALRMAVNDELGNLQKALPNAYHVLSPGGRLVVISFHSLEDRMVKDFFSLLVKSGKGFLLTPKPLVPSENEIKNNPRSRSGKLRAFSKL